MFLFAADQSISLVAVLQALLVQVTGAAVKVVLLHHQNLCILQALVVAQCLIQIQVHAVVQVHKANLKVVIAPATVASASHGVVHVLVFLPALYPLVHLHAAAQACLPHHSHCPLALAVHQAQADRVHQAPLLLPLPVIGRTPAVAAVAQTHAAHRLSDPQVAAHQKVSNLAVPQVAALHKKFIPVTYQVLAHLPDPYYLSVHLSAHIAQVSV